MAQIKPEPTATISREATPLRSEQVCSSKNNAEEAPQHLGSLLTESTCLMSTKKPKKTSPALGSPFLRRDSPLYTTNRSAHSIATDEAHVLGSISGLVNENGELAVHPASRQIDKKMPGGILPAFEGPPIRTIRLLIYHEPVRRINNSKNRTCVLYYAYRKLLRM